MDDLERLQEIKRKFNRHAGIGVFPLKPDEMYFILELLEKLLEGKS